MQGFAAVSMLLCGQGAQHLHAHTSATTVAHAAQTLHMAAAHHDDHALHNPAAATHGQASKTDPAQGASDAAHKCSICAACCNSVAIVGLQQVMALAPAPQPPLAEPFVRVQARATPVPDKPPRA